MQQTSLLCTFTTPENLRETLFEITRCYNIAFDSIYVLDNVDEPGNLCCTYNIILEDKTLDLSNAPKTTISLHRKKATRTLYTINALNMLVAELNNGVVSRDFMVPWEQYKDTILVTAYGSLKRINTKLNTIVNINELH